MRDGPSSPISHKWALWAVRIKRVRPRPNEHPCFLSAGGNSPVALFFERSGAVEHANGLVDHGFKGVSVVRVHVTIDEVRQPSARGVKKAPAAWDPQYF